MSDVERNERQGVGPDTMRSRFVAEVGRLMDADESVVVVLAVISKGLFDDAGVTDAHPDRVIDVGIREQAQIGVAGGLALEGHLPIVTGYAPFLVERPFEQIKLSLAHQAVRAILASVGASWDASASGRTHQAPEDVALMASLPGWSIHVPGHPDEVDVLLRAAVCAHTSTYLRLTAESNEVPYTTTPGRIVTLRRGSGSAPTLLAVGPVADAALAATSDLDVTVLYTSTPMPLDRRTLRAATVGPELMVVEPYLAGTSASSVAAAFTDRPMVFRFHGVTDPELRRYGSRADHRSAHGLDAAGIRRVLLGGGSAAA
jgi:transketolase